jgi:cyclase
VVVKGVQFRNHRVMGNILELAARYREEGADELVFYDITASPDGRSVDRSWVNRVAAVLDIPFCVAGGIKSIADAEEVLNLGADKISINSPALADPELIGTLARRFGSQCVVIGIDSMERDGAYEVYQYTGDPDRSRGTTRATAAWVREVQERGAGEIVLAGAMQHFAEVFTAANVDGALAATVFHSGSIPIPDLKRYLLDAGVAIRPA